MVDTTKIREHMDVLGSDGGRVGIVDKVEGDTIKLARHEPGSSDKGEHHWIPCAWVDSVDEEGVRLNKETREARAEWRSGSQRLQ